MNANAFCDVWAGVMFFKCSELHEPYEMRERSYNFSLLIFSTKLLKKEKKTQHNGTAKLLWSRNSVVASKLLARMFYSNQSITIFVICKLTVNSFLGKRYELIKFLN